MLILFTPSSCLYSIPYCALSQHKKFYLLELFFW
nr:MAG TPA: hypothetical protein [Caudoviricetes sp.]